MLDIIGQINTNFDLIVFVIVGIIVLASALLMLESKNLSHAIIFLALTFTGIAVIFIQLNAEFIAMTQMITYVGGVIVLFLFALMLTRSEEFNLRGDMNRLVSLLIALILIAIFVLIILPLDNLWITVNSVNPNTIIANNAPSSYSIAWIGFWLFNYYQIGFIILGFVVVAVLIGTIYIVKNEPGEDIRVVSPARATDSKEDS